MVTNKTIAGGARIPRTATQPSPKTWQVTLVQVRRRDAALRLVQIYQLLLNWSPTTSVSPAPRSAVDQDSLES